MQTGYEWAKGLLATKKRNRDIYHLENNTYLSRSLTIDCGESDIIELILHSTPIMTFHVDGHTRLKSGGWRTTTTKDRLNRYMPDEWRGWRVGGSEGRWYFTNYGPVGYWFEENMILKGDGKTVEGAEKLPTLEELMEDVRKERIKAYGVDRIG